MAGGLSKERLGRLRPVLGSTVERGEVAGIVALAARGADVHVEAAGFQNLAARAPMRRDSIFRIASMTKPVTAVAAMMLVEEGLIRLDDAVDRWLPELKDRRVLKSLAGALDDTVPAERPISLRDLLTFRAGWGLTMAPPGTYPIQQALVDAGLAPGPNPPALSPDQVMRAFAGLPLLHQPGERWHYHTAYDALAVLIARVAAQPFDRFLEERIFAPLGMRDTGFAVPAEKQARLATVYGRDKTGKLSPDEEAGASVTPGGGSGLYSTVDDYLAFGRMMLNFGAHGGTRLLARPTVEAMTTDQITAAQKAASPFIPGEGRGWGFGVATVNRRDGIAAVPGAYGWAGGYGTTWLTDPAERMVSVVMTQRLMNRPDDMALNETVQTLSYQAIDD